MQQFSQEKLDMVDSDIEEVFTFPLSYSQEGLWLLLQTQSANPAYHIPIANLLRGPLRLKLLEQSVNRICARHEILRTTFAILDRDPVQIVASPQYRPLPLLDLTSLAGEHREEELQKAAMAESRRPFDLARGPLFRFVVLRMDLERHLLLCTAHHLVSDGWSEQVFLRELKSIYQALATEIREVLPELPIQYGDYAHWQREWLQGDQLETLISYWREQLATAPESLELPTDYPRLETPSYEGDFHNVSIPSDVVGSLAELGRKEGTTLFASLLTAFGVLLHHLSGQKSVLVGSPASNRTQMELEGLIGFFANPMVLRIDLAGDPTFRELVRRVSDMTFAAQEHQGLPFSKLVSELRPRRGFSHNPFFQVLFSLDQGSSAEEDADADLSFQHFPIRGKTTQFDLMLSLEETGKGVGGILRYSTALFRKETIARMVRFWARILRSASADPQRRVSSFLLSSEEEHAAVLAWNDTERVYPQGRCLHEWVHTQVERTPHATAVTFEGDAYSYRYLEERSNRIANHLIALGVKPETIVAVCVERSPELIEALLAVLKAGGAYLPIDPGYPAERKYLMLEDSEASFLLTKNGHFTAGPTPSAMVEVSLKRDREAISTRCSQAPVTTVSTENLAYVIYTSGSTGKPKGAMNSHRGILNRLFWMQEEYAIDASDAILQKTPYSFDVSLWELFLPLLTGARLVMARAEGHKDPSYLRDLIVDARVTTLHFVPSMLRAFLQIESLKCTGLRRVISSGEALPKNLQGGFFERLPGVELHNLYGPTEAAVDVTFWACAPSAVEPTVPIGRPVANTEIYVLDSHFNPVLVGTSGELFIGGSQVGRGYLSRPALTAERFLPDRFGGPGARFYRTGDQVRHRLDGALEFLGRLDHQFKVRGYRIEPGEIESALLEYPGVQEAVVMARRDTTGAVRLVAYVVPAEEATLISSELRTYLRQSLPEFMVPNAFVTLRELPLNPNGKLDRKALPELSPAFGGWEKELVAPKNVMEDTLVSIWSNVLEVDAISLHDNFFALGGDSILSLRVAALARERGIEVTVRQIAEFPTVAELAEAIQADESPLESTVRTEPFGLISSEDRNALPEGVVDAYPLARIQLGMLYHQEQSPGAALYHGITSFHLRMAFRQDAFQRAVVHVASRHPNLRTTFDLESYKEPLQLVYAKPIFPVGFHDLRDLSKEDQERELKKFVLEERERPFDLSRLPQIRFHIHRRSDETLQFTLVENHAVSDGWSLHTVLAEIFTSLFSLLNEEKLPEFPQLDSTYRDFIYLERKILESEESRIFWENRLRDCDPPLVSQLMLPKSREGDRLRRIDHFLSEPLTERLRQVAKGEAVPLKSVLLAAHLRVLNLLGGRRDIITGLSTNGRLETKDADRVCGLFLNTIPLRLNLSGGGWSDLVRKTHEEELALLPYRRYPLAAIQADSGGRTLFDASFVYLNFHVMGEHIKAGDVAFEGNSIVLEETNFTLMTSFQHVPGDAARIRLTVECDGWVLSDRQVDQIGGYYMKILQAIAADPAAPYHLFSPLSQAEKHEILEEWSGGDLQLSAQQSVHQLFEKHVLEAPDRLCLRWPGGTLSRDEVNRRSDQLARCLLRLGVGAEDRVAICMDRGPELIPVILAVFKAGGAYVPVDPAYPRDRIRWLLSDSGATVALTLKRWRHLLPEAGISVLSVDDGIEAHPDDAELPRELKPSTLAYVIYTSGTTGRPKGVQVEHRQLMSYIAAVLEQLPLRPEGEYALVSTFAADLGNTILFPALCTGSTLHILAEEEVTDPAALATYLDSHPVDGLKIVPSHLRALLDFEAPEKLLPQRSLIFGGDSCDWALVERVRESRPGCRIFNHYGPTETTVGVLAGALNPEAADRPERPPLGWPLRHARVYVLDPDFLPAPSCVIGELCVGGPAVTRGYLGQPALTAEKFLPDPFSSDPGTRVYRTGDLARFLPGGRVEFCGRNDHQVKIRGFRVELREVEEVLRDHPAVMDAAALIRGVHGDVALEAYVALDGPATMEELRRFIEDRCPAHMVPARLVELSSLPLTPNGKLDRTALSERRDEIATASPVRPRSTVEERLVGLWKEVLKRDHIGVYDSFFELGGDSIKAILLNGRIRRAFGVNLSVEALLATQTVAGLAGKIEIEIHTASSPSSAPIKPVSPGDERPLSFAQHRLWYTSLLDPGSPAHNIPVAFHLRGSLRIGALRRSLNEMVRRHDVLRTRFPAVDGLPHQVVTPGARLSIPIIDLRSLPAGKREATLRKTARREAWRAFDVERELLLRACVLRVGEEDHGFVLTLHHLIFDGWSMRVLFNELVKLYRTYLSGGASPLPELPFQYADFAAWQRQQLQQETLQRQLTYWTTKLQGIRPLELPTDRPRPAVQTYRGASEVQKLSTQLTTELQGLSQSEGVSLFMTILAGYATLLSYRSGQDDLAIGCPVAIHRDRPELDGLIGLFLNTLPLRLNFEGVATFRELLQLVRRIALEAYAHQDIPFEKVVEAVKPRRDASRSPIFQVWLNHSTIPRDPPDFEGLSLTPLSVGDPAIKFDLRLSTEELNGHLIAMLGYNSDLFNQETARRMLSELHHILGSVAKRADITFIELFDALHDESKSQRAKEAVGRNESLRRHLQSSRRKAYLVET